jgi:hypothetical protein
MNWIGGGLIQIIIYGTGISAGTEDFAILTESSSDILTENSLTLQTEH